LRRLRAQFADVIDDFLLRRKTAFVVLREDFLVVDRDDEDAAAAAYELTIEPGFFLDRRRQTGGSR